MTTDIWSWVHETYNELHAAGHHRLAEAIAEISGHAVEGRVEELEAMYPEALATARSLNLPWVEVYLRHWRVQSLVNERQQGAAALGEVTSLLEFAHRDETKGCPQAVCVVQDFAICHAGIDGPGYVPERLAILKETIAGIEPARSCFDCLTREYSDALEDAGEPVEALAYLDAGEAKMRAAGQRPSLQVFLRRADLLGVLGGAEQGLAVLDRGEQEERRAANGVDEDDERNLALRRARLLARLGRADEARAVLLDLSEPAEHPDLRMMWAETVEELVAQGAYENDVVLGRALNTWVTYLDGVGSHRRCLDLALLAGRLAVARGARAVAESLGAVAARKLGDLRRADLDASREMLAMRKAARAMPAPELPVPPALLVGHLSAGAESGGFTSADPEADLDLLDAALEMDDPHPAVAGLAAAYLGALGLPGSAAALLWSHVEADPANTELVMQLAAMLDATGDRDGTDRLVGLVRPADAHWIRANVAAADGRWADCATECAAIVAIDENALNTRRLWARALAELDDHPAAQALWEELFARASDDPEAPEDRRAGDGDRWSLLITATVNRDWRTVRSTAAALGMDHIAPGDAPVDEEWNVIRLRHQDATGQMQVLALRTGPATARVLTVTQTGAALNFGDVVVFTPALQEQPPEDPDEREHWLPLYDSLRLLDPGGYVSYVIDGANPGDAAWDAWRGALRERGYGVWDYTGDDYLVTDPATGGELPGRAAGVAVPPSIAAAEAAALLAELTRDWPHPMCWLSLAEAAGADVERHRRIAEEYGL